MKNRGITLVALIITIIILLILATVSISLVINSGILDHAQHGVDKYSEEEELEQIKLAVASAQLKGNGFLTAENLNNELKDRIDKNENTEKVGSNWYYKGYTIDENGNVEKYDKLLPKEYQQVEYIESTGTQYIDTRFIANQNTGFYIDFVINNQIAQNINVTGYLIGCRTRMNNTQINRYQLSTWRDYSGGMLAFDIINNANNTYNPMIVPGERQEILLINKILKTTDGTKKQLGNQQFVCDGSLFLLCCKEINANNQEIIVQEFAKAKLYKVEIYNNNEEVRIFILCYSTTTVTDVDGIERPKGTIGLYDTVEGKFYVNKGTGTFLKGADV